MLEKNKTTYTKDQINALPVWYCEKCSSLKIIRRDIGDSVLPYCAICGSFSTIRKDNIKKLIKHGIIKDCNSC
jgi:hypothetical protein